MAAGLGFSGRRLGAAAGASIALVSGLALLAAQAGGSRSIWDGVYSAAQAKRGQDAYLDECSSCHAVNLLGDESAKALIGDEFLADFDGKTVGAVFERVRATMPKDSPGRLGPQQYADILAFLMSANKLPSGPAELDHDAAPLEQIRWTKAPATP